MEELVPPEHEDEVEILRAIYGEDKVRVVHASGGDFKLHVDLEPRVELDAALVSVTLQLVLPADYPANAAPRVAVERSRGVGDAGLAALLAAAERSVLQYGQQEDGCVAQLLADVSEALDLANESCECSICLAPCGPPEPTVRALCDHVFHGACIGRWASLKDEEAEEAAGPRTESTKAERNALRRDVADAFDALEDASRRDECARDRLEKRTRRAEAFRALLLSRARGEDTDGGGEQVSEDSEDALIQANMEEESETPEEKVERLKEKARQAKSEAQKRQSELKKMQARAAERQERLEALEKKLAAEAASRTAQGLPCPVCRTLIDRALLPAPATVASAPSKAHKASVSKAARVSELPPELLQRVRGLQAEHAALLASREARQAEARQAEAQARDSAGDPAAAASASPQAVGESTGDTGPSSPQSRDASDLPTRDLARLSGTKAGVDGQSQPAFQPQPRSSPASSEWAGSGWTSNWEGGGGDGGWTNEDWNGGYASRNGTWKGGSGGRGGGRRDNGQKSGRWRK